MVEVLKSFSVTVIYIIAEAWYQVGREWKKLRPGVCDLPENNMEEEKQVWKISYIFKDIDGRSNPMRIIKQSQIKKLLHHAVLQKMKTIQTV